MARHPNDVLYAGEKKFPILAACEHYAGAEKLMKKALELQAFKNGVFDVTFDLEDGASSGSELEHAEMAATLLASEQNKLLRTGIRIHPRNHPSWRRDTDTVLEIARDKIAYLTLPKATSAADVKSVVNYIRDTEHRLKIARATPIHVLIESHGALREVFDIAAVEGVEVLDFGLMDFVSDHHGAIPVECMRSPGQFEHALLRRAKAELVAAAIARGVVPAHNVTLELKDKERTRADAKRAREELGFLRMWSIHPEQIDPIVDAMRPDLRAVENAAAILLAASAVDWAPIEYQGLLQDRATYRYHWELLQRARVAQSPLNPDAERAFFGVRE
jgi:citrate lyase subunit beta / citryl-CoA lyase